jgi:hypothetical protein
MPAGDFQFVDAYWVVPGKLAAGEYPAVRYSEPGTLRIIDGMLEKGITFFIDLTMPGEEIDYKSILFERAGYFNIQVAYKKIPVIYFQIPNVETLLEIIRSIDMAIESGQVVYIHCKAGIGRTGVAVGCYLVHTGLMGTEALERIQDLRRGTPGARHRSPETDAQVQLVINWRD